MIQFHVYPGEKKRIVTFSFDDGSQNDVRLIELMDKYALKATFCLNGNHYMSKSEDERRYIADIYQNHEIACHTFSHGWPSRMPTASLVTEIMKDREVLESMAGYPVTGMSYPSGSYNKNVISVMDACGIDYSRTVNDTYGFELPENFLEWNPSCHFRKAEAIVDKFLKELDSQWTKPLLYIWGHSHELQTEEDWKYIENLFQKLSACKEKIWFATNTMIVDYLSAQKMLKISTDEKMYYNPTAVDIWIEKNKQKIIKIPAGTGLREDDRDE